MRTIPRCVAPFLALSLLGAGTAGAQPELISEVGDPGPPSLDASGTASSADGRFVAFGSNSAVHAQGQIDNNNALDIFLWDRDTGTITLVSAIDGGDTAGDGASFSPVISADGNYVAFITNASNLVTGVTDNNDSLDIYVYDRQADSLQLVTGVDGGSTTSSGGNVANLAISDNGQFIAFDYRADDLLTGVTDTNGKEDVYLFDRVGGTLELVSSTDGSGTTAGDNLARNPSISGDGRYITFESAATDMAGITDNNGLFDVFVFDRVANTQTLVSGIDGGTTTGNGLSQRSSISSNGDWIVFESAGTNLVSGTTDSNPTVDLFLYDRVGGGLELLSGIDGGTTTGNGRSDYASISDDGSYVAFHSRATNLVSGVTDNNGSLRDIFIYDRVGDSISLASGVDGGTTTGNDNSNEPEISGDGNFVTYTSRATNLVSGVTDTNGTRDLYLFDRASGTQSLVSGIDAGLTAGNHTSSDPAISANGRYVSFHTQASDLLGGQELRRSNIFQYDETTPSLTRVSDTLAGLESLTGNEGSFAGSGKIASRVSDEGRFVVFRSNATDIVAGVVDDNDVGDVFLRDRQTGTTTLVSSVGGAGAEVANGGSSGPVISGDGRYVAFQSLATDLVAGLTDNNDTSDVFLYDRVNSTLQLVSGIDGGTTTGNDFSNVASISGDGSFVTFLSRASDLVSGATDTNGGDDVFLYDRVADSVELVSGVDAGNTAGNDRSAESVVSSDGSYVAFMSQASNLITGISDMNTQRDIFLYDRVADSLILVSGVPGAAMTGNGTADDPAISGDGRYVAYESQASNLVSGITDANGVSDVFLYDRVSDSTVLVSAIDAGDTAATGQSRQPAVSTDGAYVVFSSRAPDLISGVDDGAERGGAGDDDVFLYDRAGDSLALVSGIDGTNVTGNGNSFDPVIDADGSLVAFQSAASDLITGLADTAGSRDVFVYSRSADSIHIASTPDGGDSAGNGDASDHPDLAEEGGTVVWTSDASNLVAGDYNSREDVFAFATEADVAVTMGQCFGVVAPGDVNNYFIRITNAGPLDAAGSELTDMLPANTSLVGSTPGGACSESGGVVTCDLGVVAAAGEFDVQLDVMIEPGATSPLLNSASVTADPPDPSQPNNNAEVFTKVVADLIFADNLERCDFPD